MLDKVIVVSSREAHFIYSDRTPVIVSSDSDVLSLVFFLLNINDPRLIDDEVTQKIELPSAA